MFKIATYVSKSEIHGLGVFSRENVPKGHLIWSFDPAFDNELPKEFVDGLPWDLAHLVQTHAEYLHDREVFRLGNDNDIFMNHSSTPTLLDLGDQMVAAIDIHPGAELTCDYRSVQVIAFSACNVRAAA